MSKQGGGQPLLIPCFAGCNARKNTTLPGRGSDFSSHHAQGDGPSNDMKIVAWRSSWISVLLYQTKITRVSKPARFTKTRREYLCEMCILRFFLWRKVAPVIPMCLAITTLTRPSPPAPQPNFDFTNACVLVIFVRNPSELGREEFPSMKHSLGKKKRL